MAVDGEAVGPHSRETMEHLRAQGELSADAQVWCEGMADWVPYADSELNVSPPPIPPQLPTVESSASSWSDFGVPASVAAPPRLAVDDDGWQSTRATPWRRYFARMFDTVILGVMVWFVLGFVFASTSTRLFEVFFGTHGLADNALLSTIMTFAVMVPIEAVMIGLSGTTVGKWVFGVRITRPSGRAIGLLRAGRREAAVLLRGLGLGIPLISLITMIVGYRTLADTGSASWDSGKPWVVTYRESGSLQIFLSIAGVIVWLLALVVIRALAMNTKG